MITKVDSTTVSEEHPNLEKDKKKLMEQCQEFESVLTGFMLHSMRQTIQPAEEPDRAREIYEEMFDQQVARELSKSRTGSLAATMYQSLEPLLASSRKGPPPVSSDAPELPAGMAAPAPVDTTGKDEG